MDCRLTVEATTVTRDSIEDVTDAHLFLGYKPLIFGLIFPAGSQTHQRFKQESEILLEFNMPASCEGSSNPLELSQRRIATLRLTYLREMTLNRQMLLLYQGKQGYHSFLSPLQQFVNRAKERFQKRASGNVGLPGNLLDQVQIAYAIQRKISTITVGDGSLINLFPTDLHGAVGEMNYASSLRIGGMATRQVEASRKLVISEVDLSAYREVYALGKNHMRNPQKEEHFALHRSKSQVLQLPLPAAVRAYRELELLESVNEGIHRIHTYTVINHQVIKESGDALAHIHRVYAQWRINNGLLTELFFV
jgi:flavin reductase (DIM6/NTAB) family NADH-FMN oxidoreductase RutF